MDLAAEFELMRPALMIYCHLDELTPDDDEDLHEAFAAAVSYMEDAGVCAPVPGTPRRAKYNRCIKALVLDAWDNRGSQLAGFSVVDNPAFQRMKNQLKHTEPRWSDSDTVT